MSNPRIEDLLAEIEQLRAANGQLQARLSCMCGGDMDTHSAYEGHSPVSMYDYALDKAEAEIERLRALKPLMFDDDECYQLFIAIDDRARAFNGTNSEVNALRERLLPFYRDWHATHPHEVHP